jgi:Carboxypeptidase regulatory-like domain
MRKAILCRVSCLVVCMVSFGHAQSTNSGDIRGSVTDQSGALIPGVTVTVLNVDTGVSKDFVTNNDGLYDTSSIVTGRYQITFTKEGFEKLVRGPVTVQVGFTGVNAQLRVGATTQQVVVTSNVPLLNSESGVQQTTLEAQSMAQLPNVGTDWQNFTILLPGTSGSASSETGSPANPGQFVAANGNLPYNTMLSDGSVTTLPSSSNSEVSTFETVAELQISTSSFSAQYGIGGYVFNQISKSGTDRFHGAAYEYFQNDALNARDYGFGNPVTVPFLRYNNYGGSIGGPILKKKMFFYFNFDKLDRTGSNTGFLTVPTEAELAGDFTGQPTIYDPTTQVVAETPDGPVVTRQSFADEYGNGNKIPANLIDPVAKAIQANYPKPNVPGNVAQGVVINNYYYNAKNSSPATKYFGRLDWDITPTNRLTISDTQRDSPAIQNDWDTCPIGCVNVDTDSNNSQVTDVWNISPKTVNEARVGFTDQLNYYVDSTLNQGFPAKLGWQFAKADQFPSTTVAGNCCFGSTSNGFSPEVNAVQKEMVFDFSDVITMIRGRHILHFGGEVLVYRTDTTTWGNINAGTFAFTGAYTQSTVGDNSTGIGYADFLLGQAQSWNAFVAPEYGPRSKNPQFFIQDDFKIRPNLTLNLGLRYQIQTGWKEVKNNISAFDPTIINPETGANGAIWYAATHANGRRSLQASSYGTVLPRLGFSWLPKPDTTIRGGFGIFAYRWSLDTYGTGMGTAIQFQGNATDQTNGITPVVTLASDGADLPYIGPTTDPAALNGQSVVYNKYHTPVPQIYQWNLAVQHELGTNMVAEMAYVGSHGFHLSFPVDINQVPEDKLGPNDSPSELPYPIYQSITGDTYNGISNYNSLQLSIARRFVSGLSFDFNYTWSHFLDDQDSSGYGGAAGSQPYQRSYDPSANYGSSNFDVRNAFKGTIVYELPFGKGKLFLNKSRMLDAVIGGWQASGTMLLSTGLPFTPRISGSNNSYSQAGDWYPNQVGNPIPRHQSIDQWFDPSAFTLAAPGTFGNMRRNSLYGPGIHLVNLSAGKKFVLHEGIELQIRADANNAFNHPSFGQPNFDLVSGGDGSTDANPFFGSPTNITTLTVGGRTLQLNARLSF